MPRTLGSPAPSRRLPAGSVDCHFHLYDAQFPSQPGGPPLPNDHPGLAMYRQVQQWLGLDRAVLVQANAYQLDHRCFERDLRALGSRGRGIMAAWADIADSELERFHALGVRGSRIMELPGGAIGLDQAQAVNDRIAPLDWSMIVQFDGRTLIDHYPQLARLKGRVVIDHLGRFMEPIDIDHPAFKALLKLLDRGNVYLKLAGFYETETAPYAASAELAKTLIRHAPERIIWGSNWPHVSLPPEQTPNDAALLDSVDAWVPDAASRQCIFVDNPQALYDFPPWDE